MHTVCLIVKLMLRNCELLLKKIIIIFNDNFSEGKRKQLAKTTHLGRITSWDSEALILLGDMRFFTQSC